MNEDRRSMLVGLLLAPLGALVGRMWPNTAHNEGVALLPDGIEHDVVDGSRLPGPADCGYEPEAFSAARLRREPERIFQKYRTDDGEQLT